MSAPERRHARSRRGGAGPIILENEMKATHVRAAAALATILVLSACGGKASFDISGNISGLRNNGLELSNNGDTVTPPAGATTFTFPKRVSYGDNYDVKPTKQPAHMTCTVGNGSGSAGHLTSIVVNVVCTQNAYSIGGLVNGLTDGTLVLANGSTAAPVTVSKGDPAFVFPQAVEDGTAYGVTVLTQPANLFCTVANGTDVMGEAPRSNIVVTCVPK